MDVIDRRNFLIRSVWLLVHSLLASELPFLSSIGCAPSPAASITRLAGGARSIPRFPVTSFTSQDFSCLTSHTGT